MLVKINNKWACQSRVRQVFLRKRLLKMKALKLIDLSPISMCWQIMISTIFKQKFVRQNILVEGSAQT